MQLPLEGQVALVTGGTRGIGRAIAERFALAGAAIVVTGRSSDTVESASREIAAAVAASPPSSPPVVEGIACDVADAAACQELVKAIVERRGRLDILVNNAGVTRDRLVMRMSDEDWLSVFDTNLHGAFYLSRAAIRPMLKQKGGRILNVVSVVGLTGNAGQTNYAASKAGLVGLTKSLAREVASRGITVNAIAPGYIETAMTEAIDEKYREVAREHIPLGRFGSAQDVAEAAFFLASPAAAYITGVTLRVDGGMAM